MAELMDCHQQAKGDQQPPHRAEEVGHAARAAGRAGRVMRRQDASKNIWVSIRIRRSDGRMRSRVVGVLQRQRGTVRVSDPGRDESSCAGIRIEKVLKRRGIALHAG